MLELKSLLIGLIFAVGVFAVKTGAGITYVIAPQQTLPRKLLILLTIAAAYLALFLLSWYICSRIDIVLYFNELRMLFQSGMTLHIIVAMGMFVWGFSLLRRDHRHGSRGTWGWLALVVPCPVCGSVIFFTTGFLVNFFPDGSLTAVLQAYGIFTGIMLLTVAVLTALSRRAFHHPEHMLAFCMLFIASYFVVSVLLVPLFSEVDKIYRIAAYQSSQASIDTTDVTQLVILVAVAIITGFVLQMLRERRSLR